MRPSRATRWSSSSSEPSAQTAKHTELFARAGSRLVPHILEFLGPQPEPAGQQQYLGRREGILEATGDIGGLSKTVNYKGNRIDIGGHRFFTKIAPVEKLWHEILGDEFISVPRLSRIHYGGKFFDYPLKAGNALSGLGRLSIAVGSGSGLPQVRSNTAHKVAVTR